MFILESKKKKKRTNRIASKIYSNNGAFSIFSPELQTFLLNDLTGKVSMKKISTIKVRTKEKLTKLKEDNQYNLFSTKNLNFMTVP